MYVPRYIFFTRGVGVAKEKRASFENALSEARIAHLNLVAVSSIFPPHCHILDIDTGTGTPEPGGLTWRQLIALIRAVGAKRNVVAADIVELAKIPGTQVSEFTAARIGAKIFMHCLC